MRFNGQVTSVSVKVLGVVINNASAKRDPARLISQIPDRLVLPSQCVISLPRGTTSRDPLHVGLLYSTTKRSLLASLPLQRSVKSGFPAKDR